MRDGPGDMPIFPPWNVIGYYPDGGGGTGVATKAGGNTITGVATLLTDGIVETHTAGGHFQPGNGRPFVLFDLRRGGVCIAVPRLLWYSLLMLSG